MTAVEKIEVLKQLFQQASNLGVLTWGSSKTGYWWKCVDHATAERLVEFLLSNVDLLKLDRQSFPHRYEPANGPIVIIEPIADRDPHT